MTETLNMAGKHLALSDARLFCEMLHKARTFKLSGWWEGSAFRYHPCGIVRQGLIFVNAWHVNNCCTIYAIDDPTSELHAAVSASCTKHNKAEPRPKKGDVTTVWSGGTWRLTGPWQKTASEIMAELEQEIIAAEIEVVITKDAAKLEAEHCATDKLKRLRDVHKQKNATT